MNFKIVIDGYIAALSNGNGIEVTESEYNEIERKIRNKPADPDGYAYRLREDNLEWDLVALPDIEPAEDEASTEDYVEALQEMGVDFSD